MNTIMRYLFIIKFIFFFVLFQEVIVFNNKVIAEQFELKNFKESLKYADAKIWDKSYFYSKKSKNDLAIDLIDWLRLRSGDAVFIDYVNFIDTKSKWPGMPYLFKQAENSITLDEDPQLIINFFQNNFPLTGHGSTMLSLALLKLGDTEKAKKIAMISWLDQKFDKQNFELMVKNFGNVISINNHKRLKNLLWKKDLDSVYQLKGIMSADDFFIAEQRVKLQKYSNSKNNIESFNKLNI